MNNISKKPEWLKVSYDKEEVEKIASMMRELNLHTVCREANCPNLGECYKKHTATFLIMGENCTRHCRFCNVSKNQVCPLDVNEPENVARAAKQLGLKHVVITSVTREDLCDGGASHFVKVVRAVRREIPGAAVELLIPDMQGDKKALTLILDEKPEIFSHNVETVPRLYDSVRPQADYRRSLDVLSFAKLYNPDQITKTGIMVGLGETSDEVFAVMDDLIKVKCDILTIGQYLRPSKQHIELAEYVTPQQFEEYAKVGKGKGFKYVFSAPLVRSSYHAAEAYETVVAK